MGKYPTLKVLGILLIVLVIGIFAARWLLTENRQLSEDAARSIVAQDQKIRQIEAQKAEVKKVSEKRSLAVEELDDSYPKIKEAEFQEKVTSSLVDDAGKYYGLGRHFDAAFDNWTEAKKQVQKAKLRYSEAKESLNIAIREKEFEEKKLEELEEKLKTDFANPEPEPQSIKDKIINFFK